ncbi:hypothetical protein ACFB49_32360 [Sphingomonas sp. DBB INV C78]
MDMFGVERGKLRAGLGKRPPGIMLAVPFEGDDARKKILQRRRIGDQAGVEVAGMPVEQDMADVKDDRFGSLRDDGPERIAQPWRALKRRFVLLMT